jgi:hypothetical protein
MTNEQINKVIAETCGWIERPTCTDFLGNPLLPPDYCNDLNAIHEAEKTLTDEQHRQYRSEVWYSVCNDISSYECVKAAERPHFSATARHRAEAFLKTLGKWEE